VQIRRVHRRGLHADAYLAGIGLRHGAGVQAQHVRRLTDSVHHEGLHGLSSVVSCASIDVGRRKDAVSR
jgi:hypothetical protein